MRLLIAEGRAHLPDPPPARALADGLVAAGHAATVVAAHPRRQPPFRKVTAPLVDPHHEHAVAVAIRTQVPALVHVLAYAGGTSIQLPWIARSLGVACTVEVDAAALLCHRGDLVHADGLPCRITGDPVRCAACCGAPSPGRAGLSSLSRALAFATAWLGDASPYPTPLAFRNRTDLVACGLAEADAVVVRDDAGRAAALGLGVAAARIHTVPAPTPAALLPVWQTLAIAR